MVAGLLFASGSCKGGTTPGDGAGNNGDEGNNGGGGGNETSEVWKITSAGITLDGTLFQKTAEVSVMNSDVEIVTYSEPQLPLLNPSITPNSTSHSTSAKTVQIGKGCNPMFCAINIQNTWHESPNVRSWDNIGAYLDGTSLISHEDTYVYSTSGVNHFENLITTNGIGNSVELPSTGEDIVISISFKVNRNGTVYGSYQHAMQNTTLANSQNYTLSIGGYGGVFLYNGTAIGIYDGMNGVDIDV